jgi:hypothetical protein
MTDTEEFKHLFAWVGLVVMLNTSNKEDFVDNVASIRQVLLDACAAAHAYRGSNTQIQQGYRDLLQSIPTLISFCPDIKVYIDP